MGDNRGFLPGANFPLLNSFPNPGQSNSNEVPPSLTGKTTSCNSASLGGAPSRRLWWLSISLNIFFLLAGQTAATLLGRFYYDQGGNSKWMATIVQTIGFPFLFIVLLFFPRSTTSSSPSSPLLHLSLIYLVLGLIIAGDNLMYSYGLLYLPVSTYSLICASQLAFNSIFSYFINSQKFTALIFNSVVLLTFSAALLGVNEDSDGSSNLSHKYYVLGFVLTLGASATYSLILSLMQLSFEKVIKRETFSVVLDMQIYTALVATCASVVGLFASGEWTGLKGEMEGFKSGKVSYILTLVGTAVSWQVASIGVVGLVFLVSSLFSNVISTLALPVIPIFAVIFFKDTMNGVKVIAMLIAIWGFASYVYQHYLNDLKGKRDVEENRRDVSQV
ncbi:putative purine permease 11 isoform X1 [Carex rostrata]